MTDNRANSPQWGISVLASLVTTVGVLSLPAGAAAQQLDDLEACTAIANDADRLACFDAAMAGRMAADKPATSTAQAETGTMTPPAPVAAAPSQPAPPAAAPTAPSDDFVVMSRAEADELRRRAGADERALKREPYESKIVRVFKTGYNTRNIELENGETWRELKDAVGKKPRKGEIARLTPASLGSWTIQYGGRSAKFKAKRTR